MFDFSTLKNKKWPVVVALALVGSTLVSAQTVDVAPLQYLNPPAYVPHPGRYGCNYVASQDGLGNLFSSDHVCFCVEQIDTEKTLVQVVRDGIVIAFNPATDPVYSGDVLTYDINLTGFSIPGGTTLFDIFPDYFDPGSLITTPPIDGGPDPFDFNNDTVNDSFKIWWENLVVSPTSPQTVTVTLTVL